MTGSGSTNADIGLIRLNSNGLLDSSFGDNGIVLIKLSEGYDKLGEISLQEDGKILLAGIKEAIAGEYYPFFIARLNTNGSYDENFANHGIHLLDYHGSNINISSILVLPDNKIIIAGDELSADYYYQAVVFKFNSDGSLDNGFGNNGFFETHFPRYSYGSSVVQNVRDIMVLPEGKFLLTGNAYAENRYTTVLLCRVNANGTLDENFGNGKGFILPSFSVTLSRGYQSFFVRDSKILVTGYYRNSNGRDDGFAALRFNMDGSLDSSFGTDGRAVYGFGNLWAEIGPRGGAVQPNGRIILGGFAYPKDDEDYTRIVMIGLQGDDGVTPDNYVRIKKWLKKHGLTWPGASFARNNIYQVQRSNDGINFANVASVNKPDNNNTYFYEDPSPAKGNNYYRLSYKNDKELIVYSNILLIEDEATTIQVYPNPVANTLQIKGLPVAGKIKLFIADMSGIIKMQSETSSKTYNWNISALNKGYYILRVESTGKEPVIQKFFKE